MRTTTRSPRVSSDRSNANCSIARALPHARLRASRSSSGWKPGASFADDTPRSTISRRWNSRGRGSTRPRSPSVRHSTRSGRLDWVGIRYERPRRRFALRSEVLRSLLPVVRSAAHCKAPQSAARTTLRFSDQRAQVRHCAQSLESIVCNTDSSQPLGHCRSYRCAKCGRADSCARRW
jgi:hypothetical protein